MKRKISILFFLVAIVALFFVQKNHLKWLADSFDDLTRKEFYLALSNPNLRYIKIVEGERKEQIEYKLSKKMNWDNQDRYDFLAEYDFRTENLEGKFFPGAYVFNKNTNGKDVRAKMHDNFNKSMKKLEPILEKSKINIDTAITIASIIQREAAGKSDMKLISGIIWNRIFKGMTLDIDATLQYAKGNEDDGWWTEVSPKDKSINSEYNTYKNEGLPPSPISNPGLAAIEAALTPQKTKCLFYFHKNRKIYCSETYKEHQRKIELYLK